MTAMDGDGIDEELTRAVSVAMLAAARAGEQLARMNHTAAQEREARAAGQTEQAQRELNPHSEAARAYFEVTARPEYTSAATDDQLREVARQTQIWRERLPEAQRAHEAASTELVSRRGSHGQLARASVIAEEAVVTDRRANTPYLTEQPGNTIKNAVATANTVHPRPAREALKRLVNLCGAGVTFRGQSKFASPASISSRART